MVSGSERWQWQAQRMEAGMRGVAAAEVDAEASLVLLLGFEWGEE